MILTKLHFLITKLCIRLYRLGSLWLQYIVKSSKFLAFDLVVEATVKQIRMKNVRTLLKYFSSCCDVLTNQLMFSTTTVNVGYTMYKC